jgi:hypothetical protein
MHKPWPLKILIVISSIIGNLKLARIAVWPNKPFGKSTLPSTDIKASHFLSTTFLMGVAPFGVQRLNSVPNLI